MGDLNNIQLYANNIFLIGTAEKGPVNHPIFAKSVEFVKSVFGSYGTLIDAYSQIADTDIQCNVFLTKTSGSHGELYLNILNDNNEIIENGFYIKSKHANESANDIQIYLDDNMITFIYPYELGGNMISYSFKDYNTLFDLANAINNDTKLLKGEVYCTSYCEPHVSCEFSLSTVNERNLKLSGASSGTNYNKNMLYNSMKITYSALEGYQTDIVVPVGMYYDDTLTDKLELLENYSFDKDYITLKSNQKYLSFYEQLLEFCKLQMQSSIIVHGIIGMEISHKLRDMKDIDPDILKRKLKTFNEVNTLSLENKKYTHLLSVVASDLYTLYGTEISNGYIAYSALVASTKISETTTNKFISNGFVLCDKYEQEVLKDISDLGYVCFRASPLTKHAHVVNGVTKSEYKPFKYLCDVRSVQVVMKNIKNILSKFIGKNINTLIDSGVINTELSNILSELLYSDLIKTFSSLNVIKKDETNMTINLSLSTKYMIEEIKTYTGLIHI